MDFANQLILLGAALLMASILVSALASRVGAPLLLVFLVLGMLAGEQGIGGIQYDDYQSAYLIASLALAVILFDGGLRTRAGSFQVALWPAVSLATLGVVFTAAITGFFAAWLLDLHWMQGLLIGAIVGSTDAAAVFSLLHSKGMELKRRVSATLEIESGTNDPMAVFLTIALVELLAAGATSLNWGVLNNFLVQMGLGALFGLAAGRALTWLINHLNLATGLYPLLALGGGVLTWAVTTVLGGSGFLAIYLAGLILGNQRLHAAQNILRVHDGMAWLSQIVMFLMLGLLATPSALMAEAVPGFAVALALMLVARPAAVWLSLAPFRLPWQEVLFIAWVGLRGAVPIILAMFPLLAGVDQAQTFFNIAFFVVLVSLVLQGWTVAPAARRLKLEIPPQHEPVQRIELDLPVDSEYELVGYRVGPPSNALRFAPGKLPLPPGSRVVAAFRDGGLVVEDSEEHLHEGDSVYLLAPAAAIDDLNRLFAAEPIPESLMDQRFFGSFAINGEAKLGDLALMYGLEMPGELRDRTAAEHLALAFKNRPVVGDRVRINGLELVVREMDGPRIAKVGLVLKSAGG